MTRVIQYTDDTVWAEIAEDENGGKCQAGNEEIPEEVWRILDETLDKIKGVMK